MKKTIFFIIPGIIIGLAAGILVFFGLSKRIPANPPELIGNTAGNLLNGGLFCESDGMVYFANPYDKNKLYSMTSECENIRCVSDDSVCYINVAGKYIYYIRDNAAFNDDSASFKGDLYGLVRCRLDGSDLETIVAGYCTDLSITGNTLVYNVNRNSRFVTCTKDIKGSKGNIIYDSDISNASVYKGNVFFSDTTSTNSVYRLNIESGLPSLYHRGNTSMACYSDGFLYYIDLDSNNALVALNLSNYEKKIITSDRCVLYNVCGNTVFYCSENGAAREFYRIQTDGSNRSLIMSGDITSINCTSKYTYFQADGSSTLLRVATQGKIKIQSLYIQPQ